jgi:hypothetical protein
MSETDNCYIGNMRGRIYDEVWDDGTIVIGGVLLKPNAFCKTGFKKINAPNDEALAVGKCARQVLAYDTEGRKRCFGKSRQQLFKEGYLPITDLERAAFFLHLIEKNTKLRDDALIELADNILKRNTHFSINRKFMKENQYVDEDDKYLITAEELNMLAFNYTEDALLYVE